MGKQEIVRRLLEMGIMASPETLKTIDAQGFEAFVANNKQNHCMVVQGEHKGGTPLTCCVGETVGKAELTPEDVIRANADRFKKIGSMLLRKMDAVSINNIDKTSSKVGLVGMVKEIAGKGFVLEDSTGEVPVRCEAKVELDDIIGVRGWMRQNTLFAEEVVYPDIPIDRPINNLPSTLMLQGDGNVESGDADVILSSTTVRDREGNEKTIPNPGWIFLDDGSSKMTVMVYRTKQPISKEEALSWLRKRYVQGGEANIPDQGRILETIPDILWMVSRNEPWTANYKGVTLLSFGNGHNALIDLRNRHIQLR